MTPEDFHAQDGDEIVPVMARFVRFVLADAKRTFSGVRIHRTRRGQTVIVEPESVSFAGSFHTSIAGPKTVRVSPGLVNGVMPMIGGVYLDGLTREGEKQAVPVYTIVDGPDERGRSFVGLRLRILAETGAIDIEDDEALTIGHRQGLPPGHEEGGAPDLAGVAFWPVAQLGWSEDGQRIERVRQISYFDKTHRFVAGTPHGRHWFDPAA